MLPSFDEFLTGYIDAQTLLNLLKDYKNPRDCISRMVKKKILIRLKNGFYLISDKIKNKTIPYEQIANFLYGPSYVSLEWALSYYQMIPERVVNVTNVTTGKSKEFETEIGLFSYYHLPLSCYDHGVERKKSDDWPGGFFIASKEKAILDLIYLKYKNFTTLEDFLESTRIEIKSIKELDFQLLNQLASKYKNEAINKFVGSL